MGVPRSRWWLGGIRQVVPWLEHRCLATVWQTLRRYHLSYKRGRRYVHSPDPLYTAKLATIGYVRQRATREAGRIVLLYEDEMSYHRRPSLSYAYVPTGSDAPRADQGWGADTVRRVAGCLDVHTGQFHSQQRAHWTSAALTRFLQQVATSYPQAERLYVALDNWPVHFHPDLRATLAATTPIRLLRLPTYAPWTNPVERVWRKLAQEVLHLHRHTDDWPGLCARVQTWLDAARPPAAALLRYTGLLCPS
jgi:DDE superfamily endonuclease